MAEAMSGGQPDFVAKAPLVRRAHAFASVIHADQQRRDGSPYIEHSVSVARRVHEAGLGEEVVAAALLHDAVEDSALSVAEVRERFGDEVAELVEAMTEDEGIEDYESRKEALRAQVEAAGPRAAAIYAADKLANIRTVSKLYARAGERIAAKFKAPIDVRVEVWRRDADMVGRVAPDLPYLDDLRSELDSFEALRRTDRVRAGAET